MSSRLMEKKKGLIKSKRNLNQIELFEKILKEEKISKHFRDKKIVKKIFVPNKLINILV